MRAVTNAEPRRQADETLEIRADGALLARCSLWWTATPMLEGRRTGFVGDFDRSDERAAAQLLGDARARLRRAGVQVAIGPVDGNVWQRYRFVTERGERPAFFLEPGNPATFPRDFCSAGFAPLAHFFSAEEHDLARRDPQAERAMQLLSRAGVTIRRFDPAAWDAELDAIYAVASVAFAGNLLFTPISRTDFGPLYEPLRQAVDPDFVRIAECEGRPVGFAFGMPDYAAVERAEPVETVVGKTQARLPGRRYAGLGVAMLEDVRRSAHARGMRSIVHALIRDDSPSLGASRRVAGTVRGYTLFASELA